MQRITGWNLKLLQTFVLVAEHRSFRKAADESFRSQSAVSAQIKELETQLGVRLFDRTTRRVALTPEGADLLAHTQRAFAELAVGLSSIKMSLAAKADRVQLACMPTITAGLLPLILAAYEQTRPNVHVGVREVNNEDIVASVSNGDIDFGIGVTVPASECRFEPILLDEMCALVRADTVPDDSTEIAVRDLIERPVFLLPQATPTLIALENEVRRQNTSLHLEHRFSQPETMINMAAAGRGAAVLPRIYVDGLNNSAIKVLRIIDPPITRQIAIISRRGTKMPRHAAALAS